MHIERWGSDYAITVAVVWCVQVLLFGPDTSIVRRRVLRRCFGAQGRYLYVHLCFGVSALPISAITVNLH